MKVCMVTASTNELMNIGRFLQCSNAVEEHDVNIIVVDEGDRLVRRRNERILEEVNHQFYGPRERQRWFKKRFNSSYRKYLTVIPERCHAETSFGFLASYEEKTDIIIEIDDDVFPLQKSDLVNAHISNLEKGDGVTVYSLGKWYNTLENLKLNTSCELFPRGHPYSSGSRRSDYEWASGRGDCILNMGLWSGVLDLDAVTHLYLGGLDGRSEVEVFDLKREKVIVRPESFFAVCSMNTAFRSEVLPAFYQLYMKFAGIDRFDDIWSGIFLKRIADHLGKKMCLGKPMVYHDKRPRNILNDLRSELEGMIINELLWEIVDGIQFNGNDYFDCYDELINGLRRNLQKFKEKRHKDFIELQLEKMRLWLEVTDKLSIEC